MEISFFIVEFLIFVISTVVRAENGGKVAFACPDKTGLYADPNDCKGYHYCTTNGVDMKFRCGGQRLWNQRDRKCDWKKNVDCDKQLSKALEAIPIPTLSSDAESTQGNDGLRHFDDVDEETRRRDPDDPEEIMRRWREAVANISSPRYNKYYDLRNIVYKSWGDLMSIDTTGAAPGTSSADGQKVTGVAASENMMQFDLKRALSYKDKFLSVAEKTGIDPAIIAAMTSRETRSGYGLRKEWNGYNAAGNSLGLLQVHCGYWPKYCQGEWDSALAMEKAMEVLIIMYNKLRGIDHSDPWWKGADKFKDWDKNMLMKGAIAAYNGGPNGIQSYENVDGGTTGRDYSNDVIARARYLRRNGYI